MSTLTLNHEAKIVAQAVHRINTTADYDRLIELAGTARFVLIGEASHGTHDFYATRAELTRRLIAEKGFRILALEADWPDMLRVHRHVSGRTNEISAAAALGDFRRFPAWMWRNTVMVEFIDWLRGWNLQPARKNDRAGILGWTFTACTPPWNRCWAISTKRIPLRPVARVNVTVVSIISTKTPKLTVTPQRGATANPAKPKWWRSWSNCDANTASP